MEIDIVPSTKRRRKVIPVLRCKHWFGYDIPRDHYVSSRPENTLRRDSIPSTNCTSIDKQYFSTYDSKKYLLLCLFRHEPSDLRYKAAQAMGGLVIWTCAGARVVGIALALNMEIVSHRQ